MSKILYTFRRCPYAMRARLALFYAGENPEVREVDLKNKPKAMLDISPKGTVPVLALNGEKVLEQSLDIMLWALKRHDAEGWLEHDREEMDSLIRRNDVEFKPLLDRFKYPNRFDDESVVIQEKSLKIIEDLDDRLKDQPFLMGDTISFADIAIFPFVRQFAHVDKEWFETLPYKNIQEWLHFFKESIMFKSIMAKLEPWQEDDEPLHFHDVMTLQTQ